MLIEPSVRSSVDGVLITSLHVNSYRFESNIVNFTTRAYEHSIPGPTLRVKKGERIDLTLFNDLDPQADVSMSAVMNTFHSPNTTNLHTHGLHISPTGNSDNVFVEIKPGESFEYRFHIHPAQVPGTFWYHPHFHGSTALQVSGGMAGMIIVEDDPTYVDLNALQDVALIFQAFVFVGTANLNVLSSASGSLLPLDEEYSSSNPRFVMVNGMYQPDLEMQPGEIKRFRMVNALSAGVLEISLSGCELHVLAFDGHYLPAPRQQSLIIMMPGSRADVAVRCLNTGNFELISTSDSSRNHLLPLARRFDQVLLNIQVNGSQINMTLPTSLPPLPDYLSDLRNKVPTGTFTVEFGTNLQINGEVFRGPGFPQHVMKLDQVTEWNIRNQQGAVELHPFHIHVNHFQIIKGFTYDTESLLFSEGEWRDTIPIAGNGTATIRMYPHSFASEFVFHCHLLDHEDQGMMATVVTVRETSNAKKNDIIWIGNLLFLTIIYLIVVSCYW